MVWEFFKSKSATISFLKTCLNHNILIPENSEAYLKLFWSLHYSRGQGHWPRGLVWHLRSEPGSSSRCLQPLEAQETGLVMSQCWWRMLPSFSHIPDSVVASVLLIQTFTGQLPQWHLTGCACKQDTAIDQDAFALKGFKMLRAIR